MPLAQRFSDDDLHSIVDQSSIYACACPAQVCKAILQQRMLYKYQGQCIDKTYTDRRVHDAIVESVEQAHGELERCLERVLMLEGWDMETYTMPESLEKMLAGEAEQLLDDGRDRRED